MNDDRVIDLLRSAGNAAGSDDIGPAMRKGATMRRRRRIGQAAGGGAGLAAVVALGILVTGINSSSTVVVAPPASSASPAPAGSTVGAWDGTPRTWQAGQEINYRLLEETFGPDFKRAKEGGQMQMRLKKGTATAERLPAGYEAFASLDVFDAGLLIAFSPGEKYTLPNGRVVDLYRPDPTPEKLEPETLEVQGVRDAVGAMFIRADGGRVRVFFTTKDKAESSTAERRGAAVEFLQSYVDTVATLAADPRVFPNDGEDYLTTPAQPTSDQLNQRYLQEGLGDAWGTAVDSENRITLKPESDLAAQLPSKDYQAKATLQILTAAQFDAACSAGRGFSGCKPSKQALPGGRSLYTFKWADLDHSEDNPKEYAAIGTMRGESAVYLERPDGSVVMAMISINGRNVAAADRDAQQPAVIAWFDSLTDELITAVQDKRVGADVFTEK